MSDTSATLRELGLTVPVPPDLLRLIIDAVTERVLEQLQAEQPAPATPYMTITEVAEYLRCSRQRIDDLLSQRRLTRIKDGARTLVDRREVENYLVRQERRP